MENSYNFSGKVAVITGAGSGIGKAVAEMLYGYGASVALLGKSEKVETVARTLDPTAARAHAWMLDLSIEAEVQKVIGEVVEKFGKIDILVNSAGMTAPGKINELTTDSWEQIHRNNGLATFLCCKYVISDMKKHHYGRIVNVSSIAGRFRGMTSGLHYAYTKAGIIGFTRQLGAEVARDGITVNVVAPSQTMTPMLESLINEEIVEQLNAKIPVGYIAKPEQQAAVIVFLCSDAASYVVGATIDVNGGQF